MNTYVLGFRRDLPLSLVGGKGAGLGEVSEIEGIRVPPGFCITTEAYCKTVGSRIDELLDELARCAAGMVGVVGAKIREVIEALPISDEIVGAISERLAQWDVGTAFAIRSSATTEDLATASSAGQQDTYLNITGLQEILRHISQCWASLFTDRAIIYRQQNGFDHRDVRLAVVVQQMVFADAAGILFTADPLNGNRRVVSIDAGPGLGDALVAGLVNADVYTVRDGVIDRVGIGRVLTDEQILELERIGRKIEAHFLGRPQDIEWCLSGDEFWVVQSRPITTLFPIPVVFDAGNHVYVSVGHQQMMTDAMKPLGLSIWNMAAFRPMAVAGGRLFVDVTRELSTAGGREIMLNVLGKSDPLIKDALTTVLERDFVPLLPGDGAAPPRSSFQTLEDFDPGIVAELIRRGESALDSVRRDIAGKTGPELMEFIVEDVQQLKKLVGDPKGFGVIMTGMNASHWLNEKMNEWLGEKNAADTLSLSAPNNITSEMGLALLDVADVVRPYPQVVAYLEGANDSGFFEGLDGLAGGRAVRDAIHAYLEKYGMRCAGEIDLTRTRWSEKPTTLLPLLLSNIRNFEAGEARRKFEQGLREAAQKEREILERLSHDAEKVRETERMIRLVRGAIGYREYPKYVLVCRLFVYKQALLREAERLVRDGLLKEKEAIFFLTFEELQSGEIDDVTIERRKEEFAFFEKLTPPRVISSEGEVITGRYKRGDLPSGAFVGLAVSSGIVEGRARVLLNIGDAVLEEDDILVTTFTDPSWTPAFVSIKGLVTEVGGLMTHGAVIAREYGLPAVVGVEGATRLIKDGQRIRVNGTEGYVELL